MQISYHFSEAKEYGFSFYNLKATTNILGLWRRLSMAVFHIGMIYRLASFHILKLAVAFCTHVIYCLSKEMDRQLVEKAWMKN